MVNARPRNNDFEAMLTESDLCGNSPHDIGRAPAGGHDCTNHGRISAVLLLSSR
jgi:hypothetical protein